MGAVGAPAAWAILVLSVVTVNDESNGSATFLSLNVFDQVYVLNGFAPGGASIMLQTYQISFNNLNFGQGYALSLLATFATMLLSTAATR